MLESSVLKALILQTITHGRLKSRFLSESDRVENITGTEYMCLTKPSLQQL